MMKFRLFAVAAMAGVATLIPAGAAQASYPDPSITITIDDADIIGGTTFDYVADAGSVNCTTWTVTYTDGRGPGVPAVQTGSGTSLSGTYKTKVVNSVFRSPIKAVCAYDDGQTAGVSASALQEAGASAIVTLRPLGDVADDESALPDTGGSNLSLLLLGGGLLLVGGGVTYLARRRQSSH